MRNQADSLNPSPLPEWLTAGTFAQPETPAAKAIRHAQFEMVLPRVLESICAGCTLKNAVMSLPIEVDPGAFIKWLRSQRDRYQLYLEAKEIRTEVWAAKIIDIAEASDTLEDTTRSKLKIDTYKWLMGADNRKTYGESKQIEINQAISIRAALDQARARVELVEDAPVIDVPVIDAIDVPEVSYLPDWTSLPDSVLIDDNGYANAD